MKSKTDTVVNLSMPLHCPSCYTTQDTHESAYSNKTRTKFNFKNQHPKSSFFTGIVSKRPMHSQLCLSFVFTYGCSFMHAVCVFSIVLDVYSAACSCLLQQHSKVILILEFILVPYNPYTKHFWNPRCCRNSVHNISWCTQC